MMPKSLYWWLVLVAVILGVAVIGGGVQKLIFADAEYSYIEFVSCAKTDKYYEIDFKTDNTLVTKYLNTKQAALDFLKDYEDGKNSKGKEGVMGQCGLLYGPEAALKFYNECKSPTDFSDTDRIKNIINLSESFWTKEQVIDDFLKNKSAEQVCAIVIIKTEHCFGNQYQPCATATAAFEKQSTPLVGRFKLYGRKIPPDRSPRNKWEKDLIKEYKFVQGPGSTIIVLGPDKQGRSVVIASSDAQALNLLKRPFIRNKGQTPELEKFLENAIRKCEQL